MSKLTLHLKLCDHGWLEAHLSAGDVDIPMDVSYLSDALGDLTWEAVAFLGGAEQSRCAWAAEPGEYRWMLTRRGDLLDVTILWFDRTFSKSPDQNGAPLFHAECDLIRFATQLKGQLQQLLNEFGEEGYKQQWGHDFPTRTFEELKELIAQRKRESQKEEP